MTGKRPRPKKGFLTVWDVAERAKARGIQVKPGTLANMARQGRIPFARKIPNRMRGMMFPEKKFERLLELTPKKAILQKGSTTTGGLMRMAREMGLTIHRSDITTKIERIEAGQDKHIKGFSRDMLDPKRRYILPKEFVKMMLREARLKKKLPELLRRGKLIRVTQLATELGRHPRRLHSVKSIETFSIGGKKYVTRAEAKRIKKEYTEKKEEGEKRVKVPPKLNPKTEALIKSWTSENLFEVSDQNLRKTVWQLIRANRGMPPEKFKSEIIPVLERALRVNNAKQALMKSREEVRGASASQPNKKN